MMKRKPDFTLEEGPCRKQFWFEEMIYSDKVWSMETFQSMDMVDGKLGGYRDGLVFVFVEPRIIAAFNRWTETHMLECTYDG